MNLLTKCDEPILNSLVRIYRHGGKWIETTRKYKKKDVKMNNEQELKKHYKSLGYEDLGWVNTSQRAIEKTQESKDKQWHKVGRCLHLIACHDIKAFAMCDSSD